MSLDLTNEGCNQMRIPDVGMWDPSTTYSRLCSPSWGCPCVSLVIQPRGHCLPGVPWCSGPQPKYSLTFVGSDPPQSRGLRSPVTSPALAAHSPWLLFAPQHASRLIILQQLLPPALLRAPLLLLIPLPLSLEKSGYLEEPGPFLLTQQANGIPRIGPEKPRARSPHFPGSTGWARHEYSSSSPFSTFHLFTEPKSKFSRGPFLDPSEVLALQDRE